MVYYGTPVVAVLRSTSPRTSCEKMNNWCEEDVLNLTSDVSSIGSGNSNTSGAPTLTTTIEHQDLSDRVGIGDIKTSNVPSASNFTGFFQTSGHLSISQPDLLSLPRFKKLKMPCVNIAPINKQPHARVPLVKTLEENKTLKEEIAILKSMLNVEKYKVAELTALQPREVQNILEEYYSLQMAKFDMEIERRQITELKRQTLVELESVELRAQARVDEVTMKLRDAERQNQTLFHQCDEYKERIAELEAIVARMQEVSSTLDALKGDDSDWTIRSEGYMISEELRTRLVAVETENSMLRKKIEDLQKELDERFVLGNTMPQSQISIVNGRCDVEPLQQQDDVLESLPEDGEEKRNKTASALVVCLSGLAKVSHICLQRVSRYGLLCRGIMCCKRK